MGQQPLRLKPQATVVLTVQGQPRTYVVRQVLAQDRWEVLGRRGGLYVLFAAHGSLYLTDASERTRAVKFADASTTKVSAAKLARRLSPAEQRGRIAVLVSGTALLRQRLGLPASTPATTLDQAEWDFAGAVKAVGDLARDRTELAADLDAAASAIDDAPRLRAEVESLRQKVELYEQRERARSRSVARALRRVFARVPDDVLADIVAEMGA